MNEKQTKLIEELENAITAIFEKHEDKGNVGILLMVSDDSEEDTGQMNGSTIALGDGDLIVQALVEALAVEELEPVFDIALGERLKIMNQIKNN